jgi:hypothetical protein
MKFDIFLCCAKKDYIKLPYTIRAIEENVPGYENIYISTPTKIDLGIQKGNIFYYLDKEILDVNPLLWEHRPSWVYQQFLKLFQKVTKNDFYVTIDTDNLINRNLPFFTADGKPIWYSSVPHNHTQYFNFQEKMFGFGRVFDKSFVADMNFFSKSMINEMLQRYHYTLESFIKKSQEIINSTCYPAEPELYGGYMHLFHPGFYTFKELKTIVRGKPQENPLDTVYTDKEIEDIIRSSKSLDYDVITMHSWCINNTKW